MANVLSQAEIDELLNALNLGEDSSPPEEKAADINARAYDFRTANKFPKEQIKTLNIVFETFSQLISNRMSAIMRTTSESTLLSVEEITFNEFSNSLPSPVILTILEMPPLESSLIFQISPETAYMIINRLLGGSNRNLDYGKQFTEIELALIDRVLRQIVGSFDEAWEKVLSVRTQIDRIETSSQFAQIVALNEPVAVATIDMRIGDESGLISVCIPHAAVEPVAAKLNTRAWFSGGKEQKLITVHSDVIENKLAHSKITMTAYFEDTPATVSDVVSLQVGDVIRLNHPLTDPLTIKLQHITKFRAEVGASDSKYAVRITDIIKGEDNDDNNVSR